MAWQDGVPRVRVVSGSIESRRRVTGRAHVLFRLADPLTVTRLDTHEELVLPVGTLSD